MNTLDIFYQEIIPEASNGLINSYFNYNILFNTLIEEENKLYKKEEQTNGVITPLLIINNKALFNELLEKYVNISLEFYQDSKYLKEIQEDAKLIQENIDIRKNIMAMLWSNATFEDFSNPIEFLKRRINFLNSEYTNNIINYGEILIFNGTLNVEIKKDEIYNETPYQFNSVLINNEGLKYNFPSIKFGISDNTLYIYAIQNKINDNNSYAKKINRLLYKINDGFNEELPEIYGIDNLKDISVSFVTAINIILNYFKNMGINNVVISSILLPRWNAKRISINKRYENNIEEKTKEIEKQEYIQHNLTEKFLRTFLRLKVQYDKIDVLSYPFEIDSNLHIDITNMNRCNNELLQSINDIINNNKNRNL